MKQQAIALLGATGSIGTQALDIVRANQDKLAVHSITAHRNWKLLAEQINEFRPHYAVLADERLQDKLLAHLSHSDTTMLPASELHELAVMDDVDIVVNALVGFAGFLSTYKALHAGKTVALANKESLVVGGELLSEFCGWKEPKLLPVDSEHSAILQCLTGEESKEIEKILITASGGPFRTKPMEELAHVSVKDALNHPNWEMGSKITIDSATMMNKGLEVIEAKWLFDMPLEKIEAVIHPQSIIHSMVTFTDGSTKAQLGKPDMKVPIQYALSFPSRWPLETPRMDWSTAQQLTFEPVDYQRFPCFRLALECLETGAHAPAILNAANEIAVERFLNGEIDYISISKIVEKTLHNVFNQTKITVDSLFETDSESRETARSLTV